MKPLTTIKRMSVFTSRILLVLLITVFLTGLTLYYTSAGTKLAINAASYFYPPLSVRQVQGAFADVMRFEEIVIQEENIQLRLQEVVIQANQQCLLRLHICIEQLIAKDVQVELYSSVEQVNDKNTDAELIRLPLPVEVKSLLVQGFTLKQDEQRKVSLKKLSVAFRFFKRLTVPHLTLQDLTVHTQANAPAPALTPEQQLQRLTQWQFSPIELPRLQPLLILDAPQIVLQNVRLMKEDNVTLHLPVVSTSLSLNEQRAKINLVELRTSEMQLSGTFQSSFDYVYALDLILQSPQGTAQINSAGNPADIKLSGTVSGMLQDTELRGRFNAKTAITRASLPVELELEFDTLRLADGVSLSDTQLRVDGDIDDFYLQFSTAAKTAWWSDSRINLAMSGDLSRLSINTLSLSSAEGEAIIVGTVTPAQKPQVSLDTELSSIDVSRYVPELNALLFAKSHWQIAVQDAGWKVSSPALEVSIPWQDQVALIKSAVSYENSGLLALQGLSLTLGENQLQGQLQLAQGQLQLEAALQFPRLAQLHQEAQGQLQARLSVEGPLSQPEILLSGEGSAMAFRDYKLGKLRSDIALAWGPESPFRLNVVAEQVVLSEELQLDLALNSSGNAGNHEIDLRLGSEWLAVNAGMHGGLSTNGWRGELVSSEVTRNDILFQLKQAMTASFDWQNHQYQLGVGCWLNDSGAQLCVQGINFTGNDIEVALTGSDLPAVAWLKSSHKKLRKLQSDALLDFDIQAQVKDKQVDNLNVEAAFSPSTWQLFDEEQRFYVERFGFSASVQEQLLIADSDFHSERLGGFTASAQLPLPSNYAQIQPEKLTLQASIAQFTLAPWGHLIPQVEQLSGLINGDIKAAFPDKDLSLTGGVDLTQGNIISRELGINIDGLEQEIVFSGDALTTSGKFSLGNGPATLKGEASWVDGGSASFRLKGQNLTYDDNLMAKVSVSPDLDLTLTSELLKIRGRIEVPEAKIKIESIPESALEPSSDIRLPDQAGVNSNEGPRLDLDLTVLLDPAKQKQVNLEAFGLTTSLTGDLQVSGNGGITANGEVSLVDGTYRAYGQNLIIRQGDLLFNGPLAFPTVQVEAIRDPQVTSDNVMAGLRVEGPARQPAVSVFSQPEMAQAQSLSYLLTGKALGARSNDSQETVLTNALLSYGLSQSENVVSRLGKSFGVKDLSLDVEGQGDTSRVAVSGTIAPNVKLTYGVGVFDAVSEVALRYQLLPQLYLEAVSGLSNALDVFYEFTYDPQTESDNSESPKDE